MSDIFVLGLLCGAIGLLGLYSLLIGRAYRETALYALAVTLAIGIAPVGLALRGLFAEQAPNMGFNTGTAQVALLVLAVACWALRSTLGGSMEGTRFQQWVSHALWGVAGLGVAAAAALFLRAGGWALALALLPMWLLACGLALRQAWSRSTPWVYWIAAGQLALLVGWLAALAFYMAQYAPIRAALAAHGLVWHAACVVLYGMTTYIGLVWRSRLSSENALRVAAIDRVDALTGLAVPTIFNARLDGAQKRGRQFGYRNVLLGLQVMNLQELAEEFGLDSNELPLVAAARAISASLRDVDSAARLANNQFAVLVEGVPADKSLPHLATRLIASGLRGKAVRGLPLAIEFQCVALNLDGLQASAGDLMALVTRELAHTRANRPGSADTKTSIHVISDLSSLSQ